MPGFVATHVLRSHVSESFPFGGSHHEKAHAAEIHAADFGGQPELCGPPLPRSGFSAPTTVCASDLLAWAIAAIRFWTPLWCIPTRKSFPLQTSYQPYLPFAARKAGGSPALVKDYRKILEQKDVDAVVVATPDHWHALQMIHSCEAGKDVYVEKPLSLTIGEGRKMVDAARRTQRVVQVGIQRRSSKFVKEAADFIRSGGIGHVTVAKCYHILNETPLGIGNPPDSAPPEGLDWDLWLGPAPKVPYNENRCLYKFRWFYDYSGGQLTNFGTHYLDNIQWALGETAPDLRHGSGGQVCPER